MPYSNTPVTTNQITTSYTSGNISYSTLTLIPDIIHSAQLEVERIFTTDRDGLTAPLLAFLADTAVTQAQKKAVFIIPIARCTLNSTTKNVTAVDLPTSGNVYNYVVGIHTIKVPAFNVDTVIVRRKTVSNEPLVNWVAGSRLTSKQLNLATTQSLYLLQEAIDAVGSSVTISTTQITAGSLAANSVASGNIINDAVITTKILDANVTTAKIADSAITSAKIADGTIMDADISASASISDTKLAYIATAGKVSNAATTATSSNTSSAIVARDASGNFNANVITANGFFNGSLTGNASTATALTSTLAVASGGTGATTSTGSGAVVLATSPALVTPTIDSHPVGFNAGLASAAPMYMVSGFVRFTSTTVAYLNGNSAMTMTVSRAASSATAYITTSAPHGLIANNIIYAATGIVAGEYVVDSVVSTTEFYVSTIATTVLTAAAFTVRNATLTRASSNITNIAVLDTGRYGINVNDGLTTPIWWGQCNKDDTTGTCTAIFPTTVNYATMVTTTPGGVLTAFAYNAAFVL